MADNDHTREILAMVGGLAEALTTAKQLIDLLNDRVSTLERAHVASLRIRGVGQLVRRVDDDSPVPASGTVIMATSPREWVWVLWDGAAVPTREAHDELIGLDP